MQYDDDGVILDGDIVLNGEYYDWQNLPIDTRSILVHELGHLLGLKHFFLNTNSAMNYYPYVAGYSHRNLGFYEEAVFKSLYQNAKVKIPEYLELYFADKIPQSIAALEKIKVKSFDEVYALATLQSMNKNPVKAKDSFAKAVEMQPDFAFVRQKYAEAIWTAGDTALAEKEFLATIKLDPKNYEALTNLGAMFIQKGETKKGLEYLKESLKIQPAHWFACSMIYEQTKEKKYSDCAKKYGPAVEK